MVALAGLGLQVRVMSSHLYQRFDRARGVDGLAFLWLVMSSAVASTENRVGTVGQQVSVSVRCKLWYSLRKPLFDSVISAVQYSECSALSKHQERGVITTPVSTWIVNSIPNTFWQESTNSPGRPDTYSQPNNLKRTMVRVAGNRADPLACGS